MTPNQARPRWLLAWIIWGAILAAAATLLLAWRSEIDKAHVTLIFTLVVLGASASGGRILGVTLAGAAFLLFDWFFLPPYGTLMVRNPLDWLVLVAFLVTSLVAAQLLYVARAERAATERAEALRQADQLKDALLASVSHDLRTPLTTIKGLAHELVVAGDERAMVIEEEADRMNRFVTDLLDVARLNGGRMPLDIQLNAVDDLLGALMQQFAGRPDRHRLHVALERPDQLLIGQFDFVQTLRILTNLTENALKYAPLDTTIDVIAGRTGNDIIIRVIDRGPGIPDTEQSRIFEPFYRPASSAADAGSAGLGLSIAKRLAELQHGALRYTQRPEGGSLFTLSLPAAQEMV